MLEIIGVLFAVQGIGGTVNYIVGDGPSWFLVNHIGPLEGVRLPLHILFTLIGLALVGVPEWKKWRRKQA